VASFSSELVVVATKNASDVISNGGTRRRLGNDWCNNAKLPTGAHTLPAGGPICNLESRVLVAGGTSLSLSTGATAEYPTPGDALAVISGQSKTRLFIVVGELTLSDLILEKGMATLGGGIAAQSGGSVLLQSAVTVRACASTSNGGGIWLSGSGTSLKVAGEGARAIIEGNSAVMGAGFFLHSGASVVVEDGAVVEAKGNVATNYGGGLYVQNEGSTFTATGSSTRVTVESNTAGQVGGGMISLSGADVMVESGAALVVQNNTATSYYGGGVYLQDEGSTFTATGDSTHVKVESNTAGQAGGGVL
jgi:hypothetical protein